MAAEGRDEAYNPSTAGALPLDPRDGRSNLADRRSGAVHQTTRQLTPHQAEKIDVLKQELPILTCLRSLAMRFSGLLSGNDPNALDDWIHDAMSCKIHAMQAFGAKLHHDIDAGATRVASHGATARPKGRSIR
jgi:hypothetical protein